MKERNEAKKMVKDGPLVLTCILVICMPILLLPIVGVKTLSGSGLVQIVSFVVALIIFYPKIVPFGRKDMSS